MNFRPFLLTISILVSFGNVMAQCPTGLFTVPDSSCAGDIVNIGNIPQPGVNYQWDLCAGELSTTPTSATNGTDPNLGFNQQVKLVKQNGNYYLFVVNFFGANSLARFDYGTSLSNTPVFYSYGALGLLNMPIGLDLVNENGNWFALVANYGSLRLTRVDLGTDISANTAVATDLGQFGFNGPRSLRIVHDGTDYFAFVTNDGGTSIIRVEFGNSISNTPSGSTPITNTAFSFTYGIDIKYDCLLGKWIGFVASYNLGQMHVLDFGSTPGNAPVLVASVNTLANPSGLKVTRDGNNWHALVISGAFLKLENFRIAGNLLATPVSISADTVGSMNNPRELTILEDSSTFHCFLSNAAGTISRIQWNSPCTNQPTYSTDPNGLSVSFGNGGMNYVYLSATASNGLTSYFSDSIYIKPAPVAGFTLSTACEGSDVVFSDTSSISSGNISSWNWDFGDLSTPSTLQNPTHTYPGTGTFTVTLSVTSDAGCSSSVSQSVTVSPLPNPAFNFSNNQCSTYPVTLTDASVVPGGGTINSWSWNFNDGTPIDNNANPVHAFDSAGTYPIVLTVITSAGCTDSLLQNIDILHTPITDFTVTGTCAGETAAFSNSSTVGGSLTMSHNWSFGDNTSSVLVNPSHVYPSTPANYDVTLVSTATNGCADTSVQNIRISSKPIPAFSFSPTVVCVGNSINFTSTSTGTGTDTISQYIWDFGDLSGSNLTNPIHAYADTGWYSVTLTVVSPTYCDSSFTQQLYVIPSPTAAFTAQDKCLGLSTQFNPFVTTPPGTQVDSVVWDFGDGTYFNGITSPAHTYSLPGTYSVTMTVYNNLLCTGSYADSVTVYPLPVSDFNYSLACSDAAILFDGNLSAVSNDTISSWLWNFNNIGTSNDTTPLFTFSDSGYYNVSLIVTTIHGCSDTSSQTVYVIPSPDFDFSYTEPCFGQAASFTFIENTTPPPPANLLWDFGDNSTSSLLNPIHLFASPDTFSISLLVLNPNTGCSATEVKQLVVKPLPDVGFTFANGCEETVISFSDTSTILTGNITAWSWDLGAAGNSNLQNPQATFDDPGNYTITLTATSDFGCTADTTSTLTVYPEPNVSFVPDPIYGSPPLTVNFSNSTSGAVTYTWNFGDGSTSLDVNPSHIFQDTGTYQVILNGVSSFGCIGASTQTISVLVPYMDASAENTYFTTNNNLTKVSVNIINKGNLTITTMEIKAIIEDGTPLIETWTGELKPGNAILYQFNAGLLLSSGTTPDYVCAEVVTVNGKPDDNETNNIKCAVSDNEFEVFGGFPNPFQDELSISFNLPFEGETSIDVYNAEGRLVLENSNMTGYAGFNSVPLDVRTLAKGVYFVALKYRDETKSFKVVKY